MARGVPNSWTILWPGLARLWLRGQWQGLGVAAAFAALLNGVVVATFLWPRIVGPAGGSVLFTLAAWAALLCFWGVSVRSAWRNLSRWQPGADVRGDDTLFLRSQNEYLRGNWYLVEKLLGQLLQHSPRDADALLMLASVYRHTRRYDDAEQQLGALACLAGSGKWIFEIDEERRRLSNLREHSSKDAAEATDHEPEDSSAASEDVAPESGASESGASHVAASDRMIRRAQAA